MKTLRKFLINESGATALEYGLILAATSVVILVSLEQVGVSLGGILTIITNELQRLVSG